jgi:hypothetical protein
MTEAQMNANRENAKKSSGPKTDAGKANSSRNATKHGLTAANPLLPGEEPDGLQRLRNDLCSRFRPVGDGEELLVTRIADLQWRLGRVFSHEAAIIRDNFYNIGQKDKFRDLRYHRQKADAEKDGEPLPEPLTPPDPADLAARAFNMDCAGPNSLSKLSRYESSIDRSIDRSLRQLKAFQSARKAHEQAQNPDETVAETTVEPPATPANTVNYKTNPRNRPNPAPEAPPEPLETFRTYPRASGDPVPPKSSA